MSATIAILSLPFFALWFGLEFYGPTYGSSRALRRLSFVAWLVLEATAAYLAGLES